MRMNEGVYGGYIEYWFTKLDYNQIRCREGIANNFLTQVDKLAEQFPKYDMMKVIIETRVDVDGSAPKVKEEE